MNTRLDAGALQQKLPPRRQTLRAGVRRPVRVVRDGGWVPHIYAETAWDLFLGQGFAMAQDRLWQMDYLRRRALGRLAEVLGREAIDSDRRHRLLGIGAAADHELSGIAAEAGEALQAFAAGVNAWMEAIRGNWPVEFDILGYEPEPWVPRDSIAVMRVFLWQLTGRLENLSAAEAARRLLPPALVADFLAAESPDETILPPAGVRTGRRAAAGATGGGDSAGGSNNWAVGPARSTTGHALLATDPHLPFALPAGLYLSRLCGAGYNVGGATYPGAPGMKFGHNDRIAWGITNLVASPRDLYVETLDPADPARYGRDGGWAPFERRTETIAVRGEPAVDMEVRSTERGPVVDELVPRLPGSDGTALALRWVGHERVGDIQAMLDLCRARDWDSFRAAASGWRLPIFNLLYADADGHIGWQAVGAIPVRGAGDTTRGYRPANDPGHAWTGYIPFDALPHMLDPVRGWVGTANNRPTGDDVPQPLYGWWAPGHRAVRIRERFEYQRMWSVADFRRLQFDAYSVRAAEAVPALARHLAGLGDAEATRMIDLLAGWHYEFTPDSVAATVFETFFELWQERVIAPRFPETVRPFLITLGAGSGLALRLITEGEPAAWFGERSLAGELAATTRAVLAELSRRLGPEPAAWRWGTVHRVSFRHPLDGRPGTEGLFATAPREAHGTSHVINNNGFAHGRRFDVTIGPEFRMVADLGDLDATGMVLATGQSGQPGSPHYTDHLERWLVGDYFTLPWRREAVEAQATGEVRLEP